MSDRRKEHDGGVFDKRRLRPFIEKEFIPESVLIIMRDKAQMLAELPVDGSWLRKPVCDDLQKLISKLGLFLGAVPIRGDGSASL
jgi:hypothetical protein